MSEIVVIVVVIASTTIMVGCFWMIVCNNITLEERKRILPSPGDEQFWGRISEFEKVSYERHLLQKFLLRNPIQLYGPLTRAACGNKQKVML